MKALEVNFDGLIGPTHNYAGLAYGNLASAANKAMPANPREAALQGLKKMKRLADLGLVQGVLPPHARPHLATLRALGFQGSDKKILAAAAKAAPDLLKNVYAAAAMWTANAATVAPSADSSDGRVHFTPANLAANFHRAIEAETTGRILKAIFRSEKHFVHHAPLPGGVHMGDEGAANHCRFCKDYGDKGLHLFVYGQNAFRPGGAPEKFPGRQTLEASQALARLHKLDPGRVHFVQQNPKAIDAGVFHNDVVAVSNRHVFFYHQEAYENPSELIGWLQDKAKDIPFHFIEVPSNLVSLADAVKSYLFNSQLLS
ncbi:MAG TPA: N-succinylarginine dihydrolase, partial [Sphingomonadales bacterium]|nr:N-succinylarginine dihydrolase [Sphingomonadales bacterium]